jgi:hypothetical protein
MCFKTGRLLHCEETGFISFCVCLSGSISCRISFSFSDFLAHTTLRGREGGTEEKTKFHLIDLSLFSDLISDFILAFGQVKDG